MESDFVLGAGWRETKINVIIEKYELVSKGVVNMAEIPGTIFFSSFKKMSRIISSRLNIIFWTSLSRR